MLPLRVLLACVALDLALLAAAFGLALAGPGRHGALGWIAILLGMALSAGPLWRARAMHAHVGRIVARGSLPHWHLPLAERDLGRTRGLAVPLLALFVLAAATALVPALGPRAQRWAASFLLGFAVVGLPLVGLPLGSQMRRLAGLEQDQGPRLAGRAVGAAGTDT